MIDPMRRSFSALLLLAGAAVAFGGGLDGGMGRAVAAEPAAPGAAATPAATRAAPAGSTADATPTAGTPGTAPAGAAATGAVPTGATPTAAAPTGTTPTGTAPTAAAPTSATPAPNAESLLAERDAAYKQFRAAFADARYADALPHAQRVVALTEEAARDPSELTSALNNLGATNYKLGDFAAAETAYARALQLLEERLGAASRRLLTPLRGLALTYQAGGRKDAAAPLLERAVAISRRSEGLFNEDQLELLEPLIDSYVATGRLQEAEQAQLYAYQLSERKYRGDPKLVPALRRLANWYEETHRFTSARRTWSRMYLINVDKAHPNMGYAVEALRGMARTHRQEYLYGPEITDDQEAQNAAGMGFHFESVDRDALGRRIQSAPASSYTLDPQGKEYLEAALAMVDRADPPQPFARGILLVELGDWTSLTNRTDARKYYEQAWPLLPPDPGTADAAPRNPLLRPGQLLYREPLAARRYTGLPDTAVIERYAIAEFTVTADGRVKDAKVVEGDANEDQREALVGAIGRAVYRPRFVDGKAVDTEHVRFRETFREKRPEAPPPPPG